MPSKSPTPEVAQKRVWKAEIKALESTKCQITREVRTQVRAAWKAHVSAAKAARRTHAKWILLSKRMNRFEDRRHTAIDRRIGILEGRLGS